MQGMKSCFFHIMSCVIINCLSEEVFLWKSELLLASKIITQTKLELEVARFLQTVMIFAFSCVCC